MSDGRIKSTGRSTRQVLATHGKDRRIQARHMLQSLAARIGNDSSRATLTGSRSTTGCRTSSSELSEGHDAIQLCTIEAADALIASVAGDNARNVF